MPEQRPSTIVNHSVLQQSHLIQRIHADGCHSVEVVRDSVSKDYATQCSGIESKKQRSYDWPRGTPKGKSTLDDRELPNLMRVLLLHVMLHVAQSCQAHMDVCVILCMSRRINFETRLCMQSYEKLVSAIIINELKCFSEIHCYIKTRYHFISTCNPFLQDTSTLPL